LDELEDMRGTTSRHRKIKVQKVGKGKNGVQKKRTRSARGRYGKKGT